MDIGTRNSQAAYAKVRADELVGLEALLRTTLRALAICVARRSDAGTLRQLVDRSRDLADRLTVVVEDLDDGAEARQARAMASHLCGRLAALERIAGGSATLLS